MKRNDFIFGQYFCGNKISDYGRQHGRVDYATLAKAFDAVLANGIIEQTWEACGEWEQVQGFIDNHEEIDELREQIEELENELNDLQAGERQKLEAGAEYTEVITYYVNEDGEEITGEEAEAIREKIAELDEQITELEQQIEELEDEEEYTPDIYQYYIIDGNGAQILEDYTDEIVFYNDTLDLYIWGVTHFGTSWSYVLTCIPCEKDPTARA